MNFDPANSEKHPLQSWFVLLPICFFAAAPTGIGMAMLMESLKLDPFWRPIVGGGVVGAEVTLLYFLINWRLTKLMESRSSKVSDGNR